jgi:nitronate monooxygenase
MQRFHNFASSLGIQHPIILAPMAGAASTPELVAAVSNAGGLGSFGAGYMTPAQIAETIAQIRALTSRPFAMNLFAGGFDGTGTRDAARILALMAPHHARLGLPPPPTPDDFLPPFAEQAQVIIDAQVPVFSFTFGIPAPEIIAKAKARGIKLMGTATTVAEARALHAAGVDAIVGQGSEAGAHRGTFLAACEDSLIGTMALVPQIVDATPLPVIASGGIMDGRGIVAAAALGASAVQMGTAFLACPESGAAEVYKAAVLAARDDATILTRAFSGRMARGLANSFTIEMKAHPQDLLRYPAQNNLTRPMRTAAAKQGLADYLSLWAGQAAPLARAMPAADLVALLVRETDRIADSL